ncbi:MAG TPA: S8 family serine peptidase [Solirubrobacterales bacterium]|nr:S8 family serine peptidase [Solirubrobacterales bacterium]
MRRLLPTFAPLALLATLLACASPAQAQVGVAAAREFIPRELVVKFEGERARTVSLQAGTSVRRSALALRRNPRVAYAVPNYIATASAAGPGLDVLPNDPGTIPGTAEAAASAGGWSFKQWNFLPWEEAPGAKLPVSPGGIDAIGAWANLEAAGHPGAEGVTVAVLDTGVAYRNDGGKFRRSPDFAPDQFVPGSDFVDGDRLPLDENGHGTHVAGTIAEKTDNGVGLTGLAYGAKLMPVRVLDQHGRGDAVAIAKGIRFAVAAGAQVINMSFNFGCGNRVPGVDEALRYAYSRGVVTVASAGNLGSETCVSAPATSPRVIGVGGTTEGGCLGNYSLAGKEIDLVAPGGGAPSPGCPSISARSIYQVTLRGGSTRIFAIPGNYIGTSMSAAHVSGAAAMVLASGVLGPGAKGRGLVKATTQRLRATARDLALPSSEQGAGLLDVGAATDPGA